MILPLPGVACETKEGVLGTLSNSILSTYITLAPTLTIYITYYMIDVSPLPLPLGAGADPCRETMIHRPIRIHALRSETKSKDESYCLMTRLRSRHGWTWVSHPLIVSYHWGRYD